MFDVKLIDDFYSYKDEEDFQVADDTKTVYYMFVKDFCTKVLSHFDKHLKQSIFNKDTAKIETTLTVSDEAYGLWVILTRYENEKNYVAKTKELQDDPEGMANWKAQYKKKCRAGKRISTSQMNLYYVLYFRVKEHRDDKKASALWDSFFFDSAFDEASRHSYMKRNNPEVFSAPVFAIDKIPVDKLPPVTQQTTV